MQIPTKSTDYSARLNPMILPSRREGMPPTKQSAYPHNIELSATEHSTGLYEPDDHVSKPLKQSTDADYDYKGFPKILEREAVLLTFI